MNFRDFPPLAQRAVIEILEAKAAELRGKWGYWNEVAALDAAIALLRGDE